MEEMALEYNDLWRERGVLENGRRDGQRFQFCETGERIRFDVCYRVLAENKAMLIWSGTLRITSSCRDANSLSPTNALAGIVVRAFFWIVLSHFSIHSRKSAMHEANIVVTIPFTAPKDPKQLGIDPTSAMFCPLLLEAQQVPNAPPLFASHSFCNVSLIVLRSFPAAQTRIAARSRKEDVTREGTICLLFRKNVFWEREEKKRKEKKKTKEREREKKVQ